MKVFCPFDMVIFFGAIFGPNYLSWIFDTYMANRGYQAALPLRDGLNGDPLDVMLTYTDIHPLEASTPMIEPLEANTAAQEAVVTVDMINPPPSCYDEEPAFVTQDLTRAEKDELRKTAP